MDFTEIMSRRYSVRRFKKAAVEQEKIDKILLAAQDAPTAHNNQPQKIIVVQSAEGISNLKKCTECHYDAPLGFIISYDANLCWQRSYDGKSSGDVDAAIVTTQMMLQAAELGIGTCWVMYFIPEAVKTEFELPQGVEPVAILLAGYPDCQPSPRHSERRPLQQTVSYR